MTYLQTRLAVIGLLCSALYGCGASTPTQLPELSSPQISIRDSAQLTNIDSNTAYQKGSAHYDQWLDNSAEFALLGKAAEYLQFAVERQPDNALFKLTYYNIYATLLSGSAQYDEATLLTLFNELHPAIKAETITPAFVSYTQSNRKNESLDTQLAHLLRAVQQNPGNSQNWLYLAQIYSLKNMYWLAASSANVANKLVPDNPEYLVEIGYNLMQLNTGKQYCASDERALQTRSTKLLSTAVLKQKDNAYFNAYASDAYLRMGLLPLALAQAKRAYSLELNEASARALFNALYFQGQYAEAWTILDTLENTLKIKDPDLRALYNWHQLIIKQVTDNKDILAESLAQTFITRADHFYALSTIYLLGQSMSEYREFISQSTLELSPEERQIAEFILAEQASAPTAFIEAAADACSHRLRQFYAAISAHQQGDKATFEQLLNDKRLSKTNRLTLEDYWRPLILLTAKP